MRWYFHSLLCSTPFAHCKTGRVQRESSEDVQFVLRESADSVDLNRKARVTPYCDGKEKKKRYMFRRSLRSKNGRLVWKQCFSVRWCILSVCVIPSVTKPLFGFLWNSVLSDYNKLLSKNNFHKNRLSESHTLLKSVNVLHIYWLFFAQMFIGLST